MNTFGAAVRFARTQRGMSQQTLAGMAHCSREYLCQIETGKWKGGPVVREEIARALNDPRVWALATDSEMSADQRRAWLVQLRHALIELMLEMNVLPDSITVSELLDWVDGETRKGVAA